MKKFPVGFMAQVVLVILLFGISDGISASNKWNSISTPELKAMMDKGEDMLLVCTLPQIIYDVKHIKGSVGIPLGKIKTSPDMPKDKGKRIIFYCLGPAWVYSPEAASLAVEMGYKNIFVYAEGIPGWAKARYPLVSNASYPEKDIPLISAEQLAKMDKGSIFLADIRPPADFAKGRIQGAKNIDMDDIHLEYASLPKDKKIVLVDHKGFTSLVTARFLASKGYTDVARLDGGFNAWEKSGETAGK